MRAGEIALADAKTEIAFSQNAMDALIVDAPAPLILSLQGGAEH